MNLFITSESFSPSGVGEVKTTIVTTPEALEALLMPFLHEGVTKKKMREIIGGAASLSPLTDHEALLSYKAGGIE